MYARFKSGTVKFSVSDWMHPTRAYNKGNNVSLLFESTPEEVKEFSGF